MLLVCVGSEDFVRRFENVMDLDGKENAKYGAWQPFYLQDCYQETPWNSPELFFLSLALQDSRTTLRMLVADGEILQYWRRWSAARNIQHSKQLAAPNERSRLGHPFSAKQRVSHEFVGWEYLSVRDDLSSYTLARPCNQAPGVSGSHQCE